MPSGRTSRQRSPGVITRRRPQVAIAITVILVLAAAWTMLAYSGALDSAFRQKGKKGKDVSTASFNSNSPAKEYVYAGGRLVATEETTGGGCATGPGTPGQPTATATSTTSVTIIWPASSETVDHYQVERKQTLSDSGYQVVKANVPPASPNVSVTDSPVSANTAYVYRVRAFLDAAGVCPSAYSGADLATTVVFNDDPLQSHVTIIRAQHVTQLRQAVDAVRLTAGIGAASWTNPLDQVRWVHFSELRTRLNEALSVLRFSQMPTDPGIALGNTVYATHLQAVRDKVK